VAQNSSHDAPWLTDSWNRNVFSLCWKRAKFMSCRRCGGKQFHTRRATALKLWSRKVMCVHGTKHVLTAA